jgi:hypothetical protein
LTIKLGWQHTQNDAYLNLIESRLKHSNLTWIDQFLELIEFHCPNLNNKSLKDVGCQSFQFYKQLTSKKFALDFYGFELEPTYIEIGLKYFPELKDKFQICDFSSLTNVKKTNISITSATIEHCENWKDFLKNLLTSSSHLVLIRTFLGDVSETSHLKKNGAINSYLVSVLKMGFFFFKKFK